MRDLKRYLLVIFCFVMIGFGCAFTLKAAVGVGAWDALGQTGYDLFGIKAGTVSMVLNCSCVFVQIIILRKNFRLVQLLQIPCSIVFGYVTNFVLYDLLGNVVIDSYIFNVMLFVFGTCWNAFFVSTIMCVDAVTTALEGACAAMTKVLPFQFSVIRQAIDVICICLILIVVFVCDIPSSIREGTIIAAVIFGPLLGFFMKHIQPIIHRFDLHHLIQE
ncbi:MAG: YitT family protein [Faecalibacillus sp.]